MKREIESSFSKWKESNIRKPLVLMGARQVGKTWLMRNFGAANFARVHEFNFERNRNLSSIFKVTQQPSELIPRLSAISGSRIDPLKDLVIFDEVQECAEALNSLKYFAEDMPKQAIMAAGSLLGVKLGGKTESDETPRSYPVGKVELIDVEPLSFGEYLNERYPALAEFRASIHGHEPIEDIFHERLLNAYDEYLIVGGMPECVSEYLVSQDVSRVTKIQRDLLALYEDDIVKHNDKIDAAKILVVLRSIVPQLAKNNAKFLYGVARPGARAREYEAAIEWLVSARMVRRVFNLEKPEYPLSAYMVRKAFKMYHLDCGMLRTLAEVEPKSIVLNEDFPFKGRLAENYVLNQLAGRTTGQVCYWAERAEKEIDFVIQYDGCVVPVEVKAGEDKKAATFKTFVRESQPKYAIRFSRRNLRKDGGFVNIPLYLVDRFAECLE